MQRLIIALISGLIFGAGLVISEMTNPIKVQNFLDPLGHWDPSLAFVMGGAVAVTLFTTHFIIVTEMGGKTENPTLIKGVPAKIHYICFCYISASCVYPP